MTPQEKAKDLVGKFYTLRDKDANGVMYYNAKQCALIAVEEIIQSCPTIPSEFKDSYWIAIESAEIYWQEVKQEIEKL